ncbi:nuclear transport factor 2 family protein [Flavobacterium sp. IMCC34852]|uniref:Nuclear transport factor 2 family protein n=1 Tax=Flavobacterium rivulicola TaxID=2732161 RepID=A0A7Y3R698_9FLAO|nr:nuclear transport factor 2 family protein [Flavobacterium sp. IMCC34852]NNT70708.1 nuclear transport factor 2 family protein [Flavobacterium sp. IMCC34852]
MKKIILLLTLIACSIVVISCGISKSNDYQLTKNYTPDNPELFKAIAEQDSIFFDAYNHCDTKFETYANFYAEDIEFYHDHGGLSNSKKDILEGTKKNICGKVTRTLVQGSIEVYPIKDYGAIEIGLHSFSNNTNPPDEPKKISRFTIFWKKINDQWKIAKVISLH